jgi:putative monooxygenase
VSTATARKISLAEVTPNRRRGGELRTLLSPGTVGSTAGFLGVATLQIGEYIGEHYHPYSEEFLYVSYGTVEVRCDGEPIRLETGDGLYVPIGVRHRLRNVCAEPAVVVFALTPLAPRPELGHVETEPAPAERVAAAMLGER